MITYKKPPVVEAMIEVIYSGGLSERDSERVSKKLSPKYFRVEPLSDFDVEIRVTGDHATPNVKDRRKWFRHFSADGTDVAVVKGSALVTSRLPPYGGWDYLFSKFERNLDISEKVLGYRKIERVGVRYINRIDVRAKPTDQVNVFDYLNVHAGVPEALKSNWLNQAVRLELLDEEFLTVITSSSMDTVLLNHRSFLLDIDIIANRDIPVKREDLFKKIMLMREVKNRTFELLITPKARAMFDAQ